MSYGGQQNQPWQRKGGFYQGGANQSGMFMPQQHAPSQSAFGHSAIFSQGGGGGGAPSVAYPQQRSTTLNPVAFQQPNAGGQTMTNSIGTVTKINNECGLINDEVFFYRNACKGAIPKLGDRVMFEASYSTTGQFKWNATLIQLMGGNMSHQSQQLPPLMGSGGGGRSGSGYNAVPPPNEYQLAQMQLQQRHGSPRRSSPMRGERRNERDRDCRERDRNIRSRDSEDMERDRKRRREDNERSRERSMVGMARGHDREREQERERDRARPEGKPDHALERRDRDREREREKECQKERERERERDRDRERGDRVERSPHRPAAKGRRTRAIRRYMVQIPKNILAYNSADLQELRQRYSTLYIPSDFFHANILWPKVFTPENAFSLRRPCQFHIMHRIVDSPFEQNNDILEPSDADYLYCAKVMLMACPPIAELYQKCFEDDENDNEQNTVHPSRLISFLVGTRGRNEPMAIGGPWSPSLDGENPDKDPAVLIRTAIRTCKALTGVDLSQCTQWYRFVELHYHRQDHKKKDAPPRIETVVIYLPDVHSCMPNAAQWQELSQVYKSAVENVIARKSAAAKAAATSNATAELADTSPNGDGDGDDPAAADNTNAEAATDDADKSMGAADNTANNEAGAEITTATSNGNVEAAAVAVAATAVADTTAEVITIEEVEMSADGDNSDDLKNDLPEATHYSKLDLKSMKVQDIRNELAARNLSSKGARNIIMARLAKALTTEKAEDKAAKKTAPKNEPTKTQPTPVKRVETSAKKPEIKTQNSEVEQKEEEIEKPKDEENEEQEEWNDVIDVDMSDIVILDEYDSSKNPEETPKELNEKEKNQLIRRYKLPTKEHIIVHPNKTVKGGKFDCSMMSLSVLLDYGPADTKERFFEVSIFAELFNEMLMRDFGFNIYKEMYLHKEENNETSEGAKDKHEDSSNGGNKTDDAQNMEIDEESKTSADAKSNTEGGSGKSISERRASKRSIADDADSERKHKSAGANGKEKEREHSSDKKMIVVKPQLLLSFIYFDTTHCGYIFEKDLEDLFAVLGLNLSRGQIRRVLGKLSIRQAFYYRKLTDREESTEAPPKIEDADDIPIEELKKIAQGNCIYIPKENEFSGEESAIASNNDSNDNDGLVNYNGIVIHVGKLLEQIKRTEKNYGDLEKLYNDLRKQHTDLQRDHSKSSTKIKDLQSEVKSLTRKLSDADQDLFALNRKYRDQHSTLSLIYSRVAPYFSREKDKDHKSDSARDKDADKDKDKDIKDKTKESSKSSKDKEKEKEKDKEKEKEKEKNKEKEKAKDSGKNAEKGNEAKDKNETNKTETEKEKEKEKEETDTTEQNEQDEEQEPMED